MKKKVKKVIKNAEHRGNDFDLKKNFQDRMKIIRKVPKAYYSEEGGVKSLTEY